MDRDVGGDGRPDDHDPARPAPLSVDRARVGLESYLAGFGVGGEQARGLSQQLLVRATQRWCVRRDRDLAEIALEEAESAVAAWGFFVLGQERIGVHPAVLVAQAAYRACGAAAHWPDMLLSYDLPPDFIQAMRAAAPPPTPPECPGRMVLQPLESWSIAEALSPRVWNRLIGARAGGSRA